MAGAVRLEERLSECKRLWTAYPRGLCGCNEDVVECHRRHCVPFGVDQAVLYYCHFRWGQSKFLGEQNGAFVGVLLPLPSGPASGPLRIYNAHFLF